MAVLLPEAAARRRAIERTALSVFQRWGYREIIPPMFEYLDVLSRGLGPELIDKSYKFVDRSSGRIMILRPDVTPQIARMVALLMADHPRPIRLCYSANVFRYEEEHAGRERETVQIGGELVGPQDAEADAEVIALAAEILQQLGLNQFRIAIGQIGFFKAMLHERGVPEEHHPQIQKALADRDAARLEQILKGLLLNETEVHRILGLLELLGREEVFDRARRLMGSSLSTASLKALEHLQQVYALLKKYGFSDKLLVDLSEVRGFGYYSGVVFEVFAEGVGYELGGGGRYDHLISKFGQDIPSTGFALHVERLLGALDKTQTVTGETSGDIFLVDYGDSTDLGIRVSQALRRRGIRVIRKVMKEQDRTVILQQCKAQMVGYAVVLDPSRLAKNSSILRSPKAVKLKDLDGIYVDWINCRTGAKQRLTIRQLCQQAGKSSLT